MAPINPCVWESKEIYDLYTPCRRRCLLTLTAAGARLQSSSCKMCRSGVVSFFLQLPTLLLVLPICRTAAHSSSCESFTQQQQNLQQVHSAAGNAACIYKTHTTQ